MPKESLHFISRSGEETLLLGAKIAQHLSPGDFVCLKGDLGSGKTTLVKGCITYLAEEPPEAIQSPTFTYVSSYGQDLSIHHFDLYRLDNEESFIEKGLQDLFSDSCICFIEWPDRISQLIPSKAIWIDIQYLSAEQREINVIFYE